MNRLAVIIGRFQVPRLTSGHMQLLRTAQGEGTRVLVLIGTPQSPLNARYPIPASSIRRSILREDRNALVMTVEDQECDRAWSAQVDACIASALNLTDIPEALIFAGRDSFVSHYHGRYPVKTVDFRNDASGTEARKLVLANPPLESADFRAGCIYALNTIPPRVYETVDIAVLNEDLLLLGRRANAEHWRFIGGHVDPGECFEQAARRELLEETGLTIEGALTYCGDFLLDDWRTRGATRARYRTMLFVGTYSHGAPRPGDDIAEVAWWKISGLPPITPTHHPLVDALRAHFRTANGLEPRT